MAWAKSLPYYIKYDLFSSGIHDILDLSKLDTTSDLMKIHGEGHYAYGYLPLRELLAHQYKVDATQVMTSQGSSSANFLIACAIFENSGGEALVESPCYQPMWGGIQGAGAKINRFQRRFKQSYQIDMDVIESSWTDNTRLLVITRLHNPSGVDIPIPVLKELNKFAEQHDAWVLVDEVFLDFLDNAIPAASIGDRLISTSSLTKVYGLGDLRFGWAVGDKNIIQRAREINDYISVHNPFVSEYMGFKILSSDEVMSNMRSKIRQRVTQNRSIMDNWIASNQNVQWIPPDGGIVCFPKLGNSDEGNRVASLLLEKYDTVVTSGSYFDNPAHIRIGFGNDPDMLKEGLKQINLAIKEL